MSTRRACTSGGVVVVLGGGTPRTIPAGLGWVGPRLLQRGLTTIAWSERGGEYSGRISERELVRYLGGCKLQYR